MKQNPTAKSDRIFIAAAVPEWMKQEMIKISEENWCSLSDTARSAFKSYIRSYENSDA